MCGTGCKDLDETIRENNAAQMSPVKNIIEKGDYVSLLYVGRFENGRVFDRSQDGKPLKFVAGLGQVIPGLDAAIMGLTRDAEKVITIPAEKAYGKHNATLVRSFPLAAVPKNVTPEVGVVLKLQTKDGKAVPGRIVQVKDENVVVDLNHPLAGKTLVFSIKVIDIT